MRARLLLCAGLAAALTAARNAPSSPPAARIRNPGTYVHMTSRTWLTMDPAAAIDPVSTILTANVYEPLVAFKSLSDTDSFVPFLAEQVPTLENGLLSKDLRSYRFPIRKGVRFHEGQELTPEDVRYSILRFLRQDPAASKAGLLLKPILGVYSEQSLKPGAADDAVTADADAVVIRLKTPSAHFLKILASLPIVVSKSWCEAHDAAYLSSHMNGTGPFRLSKAVPDSEVLFLRFDGYWRKRAALERVLLRIVPNSALRLSMLENGDADAGYLEDQDYPEASQIPGLKISDSPRRGALGESIFFTFDVAKGSKYAGSGRLDGAGVPPNFFADKDVREGFALALDYEALLRRGLGGRGTRAAGPFPEAFLAGQSALHSFDLEAAGKAFRRAHGGRLWKRGFTVTVAFNPAVSSRHLIAELLRSNLEKINPLFRLRIKTLAMPELLAAGKSHQLPLFIASFYPGFPDPHSLAFGLLHSKGVYPQAQRYANAKLDSLVESAATEPDPAKRRALYLEISRLAMEDLPQIHTFNPTRFNARRSWIKGVDDDQNFSNLNLNGFPYFYVLSKG